MFQHRRLLLLLILVMFTWLTWYFLPQPAIAPTTTPKRLRAAATIFPVADLVSQIGGDQVDVIQLMPIGASPHTFEPTPETMTRLANADVLFHIGQSLDTWTERVATVNSRLQQIDLSVHIPLRRIGESPDPHYWLTYANAAKMTDTIIRTLADLDPKQAAIFRQRGEAYKQKLQEEDQWARTQFSTVKQRDFATFHEAWNYFADAYDLRVVAEFEPSPGKEPTPLFLAEFMQTIKNKQIRVLFTEPQFSSATIAQVTKDLGITLDTIDPIGGSSPETDSYLRMMRYNIAKIRHALSP